MVFDDDDDIFSFTSFLSKEDACSVILILT